ncbi:hypothetical protein ABZV93_03040 [Actinopolymorpha sp. NPDC004070]|uniref:hypothetical protein n=1 Tax=Actinopolymorpha sp. NPDC004070 TaxID=3154548 RepID=UPI0033ABBCD5
MKVGRIWRHSPGWLLAGYVLLDVLLLTYTRTVGAAMNADYPFAEQLVGTLIFAGLAWLVWRRGRMAWGLSVLLGAWLLFVLVVGGDITTYMVPLLLISAAKLATLLSPAVRRHLVRPQMQAPPDTSHTV